MEILCSCQGACNCKTFAPVLSDTGIVLHLYLRHPITYQIIPLKIPRTYLGKERLFPRYISHFLNMDLETCHLLIDGQLVSYCVEQRRYLNATSNKALCVHKTSIVAYSCSKVMQFRNQAFGYKVTYDFYINNLFIYL